MYPASVLLGPAHAATPWEVGSLSEEEARALFQRFRFIKNGGEPFCPKCGCLGYNKYKCRAEFKCKDCGKRYTLTSGTAFAYRKLSFKSILGIIAEFNIAYQGRSAREIRRNIRSIKNYKTVFLWIHKLRAALKTAQESTMLSGEIEVDGAELGGHIRPKNTAKERTDLRTIPYRASDRKMNITLARGREGGCRGWVAKEEEHPVPRIIACTEPGVVFFADGGKWGKLRARGPVKTVPHKWTYYTPESCTNNAESGFRILRGFIKTFRRICDRYLDLYTAQLVWRIERVNKTDDEGFAELLGAMFAAGRSPLAGYFVMAKDGGRKRQCEIVLPDGAQGWWAPPSKEEREERKKRRPEAEKHTPVKPLSTLRMARSKDRWDQGFEFVSSRDIASGAVSLPVEPGVYGLFLAGGKEMLDRTGFTGRGPPVWEHDGRQHLYTGETYCLRARLDEHLVGGVSQSNLRETLLSLQWCEEALPEGPSISRRREATEDGLTSWMQDRIVVGFKVCGYVREVERHLLERTASPLNIRGRDATPYAQGLQQMRARFRDEVVRLWEAPTRPIRKPLKR